MTLHEAIVALLGENGNPMSTREIAEELNRRETYRKRDGSPITPFQIHGRTKNYPGLFKRDGTTVSLREWERTEGSISRTSSSPPTGTRVRFPHKQQSRGQGERMVLEWYVNKEGGLFIAEVPVSIPDAESDETPHESRRIDAIRVPTGTTGNLIPHRSFEDTATRIKGHTVELIEVKKELNRSVIGQVVVGRDFFKHRYNHWDIEMVILTRDPKPNQSLLKWCRWNNIKVIRPG